MPHLLKVTKQLETPEEFLEFEKSKVPFFDDLYKSFGCEIVVRPQGYFKDYDVIIEKDGLRYKVEEKARTSTWPDILIETTQDTESNKDGWINYTKADLLVYGMFGEPIKVYRISLRDFKPWFNENKSFFDDQPSSKGFGYTLNKIVPIDFIPANLYKKIY